MHVLVFLADWVTRLLQVLIVIHALASWFRPDPRGWYRILHAVVDPVLHPIRALLPNLGGMDFSPMIAILALSFLRSLLINALPQ